MICIQIKIFVINVHSNAMVAMDPKIQIVKNVRYNFHIGRVSVLGPVHKMVIL